MKPLSRHERIAAIVLGVLGAAFVAAAAAFTRPSNPPATLPGTDDGVPTGVAALKPPNGSGGEGIRPPHDPNAPAGEVAVEVADEAGAPVAGAAVELFEVRGGFASVGSGTTGPDGRFRFQRVPSGRSYCVMARAPGLAPVTTESMTLAAGTLASRKLVLTKGTPAKILVTKGGAPLAGAVVVVSRAAPAAEPGVTVPLPVATLRTGEDGTVSIDLLPGQYTAQTDGPPVVSAGFRHTRESSNPVVLSLP